MTAALLNKLGEIKPSWTGDRSNLMRGGVEVGNDKELEKPSMQDLGGAFFMVMTFYALGCLFGKVLFPKILGVAIHPFAWMIVMVTIAAATGIVPEKTRAAAKKLQSFFTSNLILVIMVGVGTDCNLQELINAITLSNVVIAFLIVAGAIVGSALAGYAVGFYPIDSAITAGLCMANRGGSGDIAVLGASKRMSLMAYAQLSSRLGGGIVLVLGSILMGMWIGH